MGWKHLVLEAHCFYDHSEEIDQEANVDDKIPHCCKFGQGKLGKHCLQFDEFENRFCPYLAFGTARTAVVLTGIDGEEEAFKAFWVDDNLTSEEWINKEKLWIEGWKKKISE